MAPTIKTIKEKEEEFKRKVFLEFRPGRIAQLKIHLGAYRNAENFDGPLSLLKTIERDKIVMVLSCGFKKDRYEAMTFWFTFLFEETVYYTEFSTINHSIELLWLNYFKFLT